jgi:hypothetical protein
MTSELNNIINNLPNDRLISIKDLQTNIIKLQNVICNYQLLFKFFYENNKFKNIDFYTKIQKLSDEFFLIYKYFSYLENYNDYIKFSLGDSLDKFNFLWNIIHQQNDIIIQIPFSGSMFDNINEYEYKINSSSTVNILSNYNDLIKNNHNFKLLVKLLKTNKVLITDYIASGKSFETLLILLDYYEVNLDNLYFLFISYTDNIENKIRDLINNKYEKYNFNNIEFIILDNVINRYYTNSEDTNSRCVPKYSYDLWQYKIKDIETKFLENNMGYYNCNLHRFGYLLFSICFYYKFITKNTFDKENNDSVIKKKINNFITNMTGGYYDKYIKYKMKYIKLKNNL